MDRNKDYWENFYKSEAAQSIGESSNFATFTLDYLRQRKSFVSLLDVGCGNGRDTRYFRENGIAAYGIDLSCDDSFPYLYKEDALSISKECDVYYLRFFVHTLEEKDLDIVIKNIGAIMPDQGLIFIETRSTKDITNEPRSETNFRSTIGSEHFRMLYSLEYLQKKFVEDFNVLFSIEEQGLAPFKGEDPYIVRMILSKKQAEENMIK
jgi:SAM-dependent methyltransferase